MQLRYLFTRRILPCLALLAALCGGACVALPYLTSHEAMERVYEFSSPPNDVTYRLGEDGVAHADTLRRPTVNWTALHTAQPDAVAWVRVEGTAIDYPIVQARPDAPEFFLTHDLWGNESPYGCPFIDADCTTGSAFIPVYGHHLIDGSMFSGFTAFSDPDFARAHREVIVEMPGEVRPLRVLGARIVNADTEGIRTAFSSPDDVHRYLTGCLEGAAAVLEVPDEGSYGRIWAFITCSYGSANERTVVLAAERAQASTASS